MKKILIIFLLTCFFVGNTFAYELTQKEKKLIDEVVQKVELYSFKRGENFKKQVEEKLETAQNRIRDNERIFTLLGAIISGIQTGNRLYQEPIKEETVVQLQTEKKLLGNIDFDEVKNYWLEITNREREKQWLEPYSFDEKLEKTANLWSQVQKQRGEWTHKRDPWDSFYNYSKINTWFADNGVQCKNIYRVTHSENVGSRWFSCSDDECTEETKQAVKKTFDFYMSEKGKDYSPHYDSLMNGYFTKIWFGLDIEKKGNNSFEYYLTVHYCTELQ